jgi:hypothetical protein
MNTPTVSLRLPRPLIKGLRREAHRESLRQNAEVSWVAVLCKAAERYLEEQDRQAAAVAGR